MNRRLFLRRSALIATGAIAADQIDLLEKLGGWTRTLFPGFGEGVANPTVITDADLSGLLKNFYTNWRLYAQNEVTPLLAQHPRRSAYTAPRDRGDGHFWDVVVTR